MPPICLDTPICFDSPIQLVASKHTGGASKHMAASKQTGSIQTYGAYGHPLVWQSMHYLCCLCTEGIQMYGCIWTPLVWQSMLMPPYVWTPPIFGCLPVCLGTTYVWMPSYVWIPPYIWIHPLYVLDCPNVWITPCKFGHPVFGCLMYVWTLPYVWMPPCMFGRCLDACCVYTTKRKHVLLDWGGVHMSPYISMPPVCLDTPISLDVTHTFGCPYIWGTSKHTGHSQTYGGYPNIQGVPKHVGASDHTEGCPNRGHPNIWGIQTYGSI